MTATATLPHWDMTVVYPSLDSPEFEAAFATYGQKVTDLAILFDGLGISPNESAAVDAATISAVESVLAALGSLLEMGITVRAYIHSFVTTNSQNTLAQSRSSELSQKNVILSQLQSRFTAWIGSLDVETLIEKSPEAAVHAFLLRKAKESSLHLMSPAEESLAAELEPSSGTAWSRLHGNVTSQLLVPTKTEAGIQDLPMSAVRNLALSADRETRRRGYESELAAWERAAVPLAAALNSIKAETNVLSRKRGWNSPLDSALFDNNIDRETLDAMMEAAWDSFPDFRRYLRAKARAFHVPALAWYDIVAPLGSSEQTWEYEDATRFIVEQFATYSDKLSDFAARAFRENWIDAEPRAASATALSA